MNKQIIIPIIIVIILGLGVTALGYYYVMPKNVPAGQKPAVQASPLAPPNTAPVAVPYAAKTYPQKVIAERLMTAEEKTKYGVAPDVQAKIKIMTSSYDPNAQITIVELPKTK